MNEYEIASLNYQAIAAWATVAYVAVSLLTAGLIFYGIRTMSNSNNRRTDAINRQTEETSRADERRHKEAMAAQMAAHKEFMEAHKAAHEEFMAAHRETMAAHKAAHEESMTALKALIANGEKTSEALVELLRRTGPDGPAGAD